ncbi:MAG: HDOD domain-containing protein [Candidatus Kapaibacteriales bacterium]
MKTSLLFALKEQQTLSGLIQMLIPMQNEWDVFFADSSERALQLLANNQINYVFSDFKFTLPNGANLLGEIKKIFPNTIRFAIVPDLEQSTIGQISQFVHQFITLPFSLDDIKNRIQKTSILQDTLKNEKIISLIKSITNLPSLPEIYIQIENETNKPDFSLQKIANLISKDPNLTAKILQIVNSALFGLQREITNINFALSYLGINVIKSLVFYIQLFSSFKVTSENRKYLEKIWHHSMVVASTTFHLAQKYLSNQFEIDSAYTAGVLHDIGKFVLLSTFTYPQNVQLLTEQKYISEIEAEKELYGCTHSEIGAYLLGLWGFPHIIVEAVAFHHNPSILENEKVTLATITHLANAVYYLPPIDIRHLRNIGFESKLLDVIDYLTRPKPFKT